MGEVEDSFSFGNNANPALPQNEESSYFCSAFALETGKKTELGKL